MPRSPVSTGRLHPSRDFHLRPIEHVFHMRATGTEVPRNPNLGAGFPLRCFQRLSLPNVANRPCRWRDNRHTRGPSTQVLSYYGQASSGFQRAQRIETKLSHDVLNPARVPLKSANSRTLGTCSSPRMRRADIEVPNHPVDMDSWE